MACIGLNMVVMGMTYFGQSDAYTLFLEVVNYFFALIFTIEAVIKLSGLGKAYFFDAWNVRVFLHMHLHAFETRPTRFVPDVF
jgi:hypothetical protein